MTIDISFKQLLSKKQSRVSIKFICTEYTRDKHNTHKQNATHFFFQKITFFVEKAFSKIYHVVSKILRNKHKFKILLNRYLWAGNVARMGKGKIMFRVLVGKTRGNETT